jgi:hypothetical protein
MGYGKHPPQWVALQLIEHTDFFQICVDHTCGLSKYALCGISRTLSLFNEPTRQRPFPFSGFHSPFDQENFERRVLISENDTINGNVSYYFSEIMRHDAPAW